jgi:hypothetical protein
MKTSYIKISFGEEIDNRTKKLKSSMIQNN